MYPCKICGQNDWIWKCLNGFMSGTCKYCGAKTNTFKAHEKKKGDSSTTCSKLDKNKPQLSPNGHFAKGLLKKKLFQPIILEQRSFLTPRGPRRVRLSGRRYPTIFLHKFLMKKAKSQRVWQLNKTRMTFGLTPHNVQLNRLRFNPFPLVFRPSSWSAKKLFDKGKGLNLGRFFIFSRAIKDLYFLKTLSSKNQ